MKKEHLLSFVVLIVLLWFLSQCNKTNEKIIGVELCNYDGDFDALTKTWMYNKINTAFVGKSLASNVEFRNSTTRHKIKTFLVFPVYSLSGKDVITASESESRPLTCLSHSDFYARQIMELANIARTVKPDGISLDITQLYDSGSMMMWGRQIDADSATIPCHECLLVFESQYGVAMPDSLTDNARRIRYILSYHSEEWKEFRLSQASLLVKQLVDAVREINANIKIGVYGFDAIPAIEGMVQYVDYFLPKRNLAAIKHHSGQITMLIKDLDRYAPGKIIPTIQVGPNSVEDYYPASLFNSFLNAVLVSPSRGVVLNSWDALEKDTDKLQVVRNTVN